MQPSRERLLKQVAQLAAEGALGNSVKQSLGQYEQLSNHIAVFAKVVEDFVEGNAAADPETARFRDLVAKLLIVAYRDARRVRPLEAEPFISSLISDYPGAQESALLTRWNGLAQACLAYQEVVKSTNRILMWQQMERLFLSYNEFLDGLLGYLVILQRAALRKDVKPGVFSCAYGNKVCQFNNLTGGEDGAYYIFIRLARPAMRNASAHGRMWLDSSQDAVRYVDGRQSKTENVIDLTEFAGLVHLGSHLSMPYMAAVSAWLSWRQGRTMRLRAYRPN